MREPSASVPSSVNRRPGGVASSRAAIRAQATAAEAGIVIERGPSGLERTRKPIHAGIVAGAVTKDFATGS